MIQVPLTQNRHALIDDEDLEKIAPYRWCFHAREGYAIATVYGVNPNRHRGQTTLGMHRVIADTPLGMETDHINGNKLDNRKANLRVCTKSDNLRNMAVRKDNACGYKGVYYDKEAKKWKAQISANGKRKSIGRYATAKEAAQAFNEAAKVEYGDFAWLNPI